MPVVLAASLVVVVGCIPRLAPVAGFTVAVAVAASTVVVDSVAAVDSTAVVAAAPTAVAVADTVNRYLI
jgi:hypothetical protein